MKTPSNPIFFCVCKMQLGRNTTETSSALWSEALRHTKRSKTKKADVRCPIFEEAAGLVDDPYWKSILSSCATKKFPRGFVYDGVTIRHKRTGTSIIVPSDAETLAEEVVDFFRESGKLLSKRDLDALKKEEELVVSKIEEASKDWGNVSRSKAKRATYIRAYVDSKYKDLPPQIRDDIYTQILVAYELKIITNSHIHFVDGVIRDIDGINVDQGRVSFTRSPPGERCEKQTKTKDAIQCYYPRWCAYLSDIRKNTELLLGTSA